MKAFFIIFFISFSSLSADWDPEFLNLEDTTVLERQDFIDLKTRVSHYLQNSWCSKEKAEFLLDVVTLTSPNVCVEIGPFVGSTTLPILAALRYSGKGSAYVIDAWSCREATCGLPPTDVNTQWWGSLDMRAIRLRFNEMLTTWSLHSFCCVLPMTSKNAASRISSIDFLHLDGNFSEAGALLDSKLYVPKVRPGGYIVLSNVHVMIDGLPSKMKALAAILDQCTVICEIDDGQTLLFRKD